MAAGLELNDLQGYFQSKPCYNSTNMPQAFFINPLLKSNFYKCFLEAYAFQVSPKLIHSNFNNSTLNNTDYF